MRISPQQIAYRVFSKLAEIPAMPQPPEVPDEELEKLPPPVQLVDDKKKLAALSPIELRELRNDLAAQYDLQGEEAALRAAPSQAVVDAIKNNPPSLRDKLLWGTGGSIVGSSLGGGMGALSSYLGGGVDKMLKPTVIGALAGAGGGALAGTHYLRRKQIQKALEDVNSRKTASVRSEGLLKIAARWKEEMPEEFRKLYDQLRGIKNRGTPEIELIAGVHKFPPGFKKVVADKIFGDSPEPRSSFSSFVRNIEKGVSRAKPTQISPKSLPAVAPILTPIKPVQVTGDSVKIEARLPKNVTPASFRDFLKAYKWPLIIGGSLAGAGGLALLVAKIKERENEKRLTKPAA